MITIIHGDNISMSRKLYMSIKEKAISFHTLDGDTLTKQALVQIVEGGELFSDTKNIFIENLFGKKKSPAVSKEIAEYISQHTDDAIYVLWEGKELTSANLKLFPTTTSFQNLKLPQVMFSFLDNFLLIPKQERVAAFHETLKTVEPDLVFFMMVRHIRLLLAVSETSSIGIEELKTMKDWQKNKLQQLARKFSKDDLKSLYNKLFRIDLNTKTGGTPLSLTQSIDFLLLEI